MTDGIRRTVGIVIFDDVEVLGLHDLLLRVIDFGTPSPEPEEEPCVEAVEGG